MQLFIPPLGTKLLLTQDWYFSLYDEYRNSTLFEYLGLEQEDRLDYSKPPRYSAVMICAGEVLRVDRIYIRKNQSDFDSVSFFLEGKKTQKQEGVPYEENLVDVEFVTGVSRNYGKGSLSEFAPLGVVATYRKEQLPPMGPLGVARPYKILREYKAKGVYGTKPAKPVRFWAKLEDANKIVCEIVSNQEENTHV